MKQKGTIEQCLRELGYVIVPVRGSSMLPLLPEGKSLVQLIPREGQEPGKGDMVLYQRRDGTRVLHRIVKVTGENTCLVCGDHQWRQKEQIRKDRILAVAQGFFRNGRYVDDTTGWYRIYKKIWTGSMPVRRCCLAFLRLSGLEKKYLK